MELESQVTSLDLSKKLNELGIKQDSLFCYQPIKDEMPSIWPRKFNLNEFAHPSNDERLAAFTAHELGEILPNRITTKENEPFNSFTIIFKKFISVDEDLNRANNWIINYECDSTEINGINAWLCRKLTKSIYDPNLANAMAKIIIFLIENGLMKND